MIITVQEISIWLAIVRMLAESDCEPQNSHPKQTVWLIVLPGISPFVENPGIAALVKALSFKNLCLDAGLRNALHSSGA